MQRRSNEFVTTSRFHLFDCLEFLFNFLFLFDFDFACPYNAIYQILTNCATRYTWLVRPNVNIYHIYIISLTYG